MTRGFQTFGSRAGQRQGAAKRDGTGRHPRPRGGSSRGVLERNRWRMSRAARELGLERSHLYKKLKALGIERQPSD